MCHQGLRPNIPRRKPPFRSVARLVYRRHHSPVHHPPLSCRVRRYAALSAVPPGRHIRVYRCGRWSGPDPADWRRPCSPPRVRLHAVVASGRGPAVPPIISEPQLRRGGCKTELGTAKGGGDAVVCPAGRPFPLERGPDGRLWLGAQVLAEPAPPRVGVGFPAGSGRPITLLYDTCAELTVLDEPNADALAVSNGRAEQHLFGVGGLHRSIDSGVVDVVFSPNTLPQASADIAPPPAPGTINGGQIDRELALYRLFTD